MIKQENIYIQIGAGAGDQDERAGYRDGFTEYIKSLNKSDIDRILLIEPNPINIPNLKKCWEDYPQVEIYNIGICSKTCINKNITFYYTEEDAPHYQVFSMKKQHVRNHYKTEDIKETQIICQTLQEFLDLNVGDKYIEVLALDIEGIDGDIILEMNWEKMKCKKMTFEFLHLGNQLEIVETVLTDAGFKKKGLGFGSNDGDFLYEKEYVQS